MKPVRKGPILNYTTSIDATRSVAEVQGILARHGARRVTVDYAGDGTPEGLSFEVQTRFGPRSFRLPARIDGVLEALRKHAGKGKVTRAMVTRGHAARVAWRILKDGIEVRMAWVEAELVSVEEELLAHMIDGPSGRTMFEFIGDQIALPGPKGGD